MSKSDKLKKQSQKQLEARKQAQRDEDARRELEKMEKQNPDEMRHIYTRIRLSTPVTFETVGHKELTPEDIRKTDEIARERGWFGDD